MSSLQARSALNNVELGPHHQAQITQSFVDFRSPALIGLALDRALQSHLPEAGDSFADAQEKYVSQSSHSYIDQPPTD